LLLWRLLLGLRTFADVFRWKPEEGTEVIIVPIDDPNRISRFRVDPFHVFHFAGAFEDGDDIVVDYVRYPDASLLPSLGDGRSLSFDDPAAHVHGTLHRARIDAHRKSFASEPRWDGHCEFPRVACQVEGRRHGQIWMQSSHYQSGALRSSVTRIAEDGATRQHHLEAGMLSSEPVPAQVAGGAETSGSVLITVYDSCDDRSHVRVLDADSLELQAKIPLTQTVPIRFHGSWVPAAS
jgi:all-trans-8'-apo-beta-carotenal 15,15'-oxygenase